MLHVYTGDGKGKTTASVGMAVRAAGHGMKVLFCQFMKNGDSGELEALRQLGVRVLCSPPMRNMTFQMTPEEWKEHAAQQNQALTMMQEEIACMHPDMVIFDELAVALSCGMIQEAEAGNLIHACEHAEVVVTGRDAPQWLCDMADYLSVLQCVRHPYMHGAEARLGIEW